MPAVRLFLASRNVILDFHLADASATKAYSDEGHRKPDPPCHSIASLPWPSTNLSTKARVATAAIVRIRVAAAHEWGPSPNATWPEARRVKSRRAGTGNCSGSRLAEASIRITRPSCLTDIALRVR